MKHLIAPSVLAANFGNLAADLKMVSESNADWLHVENFRQSCVFDVEGLLQATDQLIAAKRAAIGRQEQTFASTDCASRPGF